MYKIIKDAQQYGLNRYLPKFKGFYKCNRRTKTKTKRLNYFRIN